MPKQLNREKQTAVLREAQKQRRQQKKEQVLRAIQEILKSGKPLNFPTIASVAGCSVSYLYKWPEISAYIHDLQNQKAQQLHELEIHEPGPHSLKTIYESSKERIRELEAENRELKRQNEKLRGYVAEIFELQDECQRLRTQLQELTSPASSSKVISLQVKSNPTPSQQNSGISPEIVASIQAMGIKLGVRLEREIRRHDPEKVKLAIEAFGQYRSQTAINSPGACLLTMIRDEAQPNIPQLPKTPEEEEFERWYKEAVQVGFCQDIPQNYLSVQNGKLMVRVINEDFPAGYELMFWREAKSLRENRESFSN